MTTIRAFLKLGTTAGLAAVPLLIGGPAAWARVLPDPLVEPVPIGAFDPPPGAPPTPAASGPTSSSIWHIALPATAGALVAIALTLLVARLLTARRNAGNRPASF